MNDIKIVFLYIRHLSFIAFLGALIVLFPGFKSYEVGNTCFLVSIIYIVITFIVFLIKSKEEEYNLLNNFVLSFLHIYICLIAYKYSFSRTYVIGDSSNYFEFNFLIISICMTILTFNKLFMSSNY